MNERRDVYRERFNVPLLTKQCVDSGAGWLLFTISHAKLHLPAAMPFLDKKLPLFIDKPFCYRLAEGKTDSRRLLEVENQFSDAQVAALESRGEYEKARV